MERQAARRPETNGPSALEILQQQRTDREREEQGDSITVNGPAKLPDEEQTGTGATVPSSGTGAAGA
jgi:hypothetical protein